MNNLLTDYGILVLIILFIIISLYYKNFINIALFVILFLGLRVILENNNNALIYAYTLAIIYGIVKNFHLLENFSSQFNGGFNRPVAKADGAAKAGGDAKDDGDDDE